MGIGKYYCKHCKELASDSVYFVVCGNCGTSWCCNECAEADNHDLAVEYCGEEGIVLSSCVRCRPIDKKGVFNETC